MIRGWRGGLVTLCLIADLTHAGIFSNDRPAFDVGVLRIGSNCPRKDVPSRPFMEASVEFNSAVKFARAPVVIATARHEDRNPDHIFEANTAEISSTGFQVAVQRVDPDEANSPGAGQKGWCYEAVDVHWMAYGIEAPPQADLERDLTDELRQRELADGALPESGSEKMEVGKALGNVESAELGALEEMKGSVARVLDEMFEQ